MARKIIVIGAGFSGFSAAAYLARQGFDVEILEKNAVPGGRSRMFESGGYRFDMGPSWLWMPDVFNRFFAHFDDHHSNYYKLLKLDPLFRIFTKSNEPLDTPSSLEQLYALFEQIEPGSSNTLHRFLDLSQKRNDLLMKGLIYKPGKSFFNYIRLSALFNLVGTRSFMPLNYHINNSFKDPRLKAIVKFPALFMGHILNSTPALYSLANYTVHTQGFWYPVGGMQSVANALEQVCYNQGVTVTYNVDVDQLDILMDKVNSAHVNHRNFYGEYFVSSADYYHTDMELLSSKKRNYNKSYWERKKIGASALIFYIGLNTIIPNLAPVNYFPGETHREKSKILSKQHNWPEDPEFIVSVPSKIDPGLAPEGHETLKIVIPVYAGLSDTGKIREHYFEKVIEKIERSIGVSFSNNIAFHQSYAHTDFNNDYNAYKGNAFGLAISRMQMGPFRPKMGNSKLPNLFYTGHYTTPGPGLPLSLISGEIVAREIFSASGGRKS